MKLLDCTLRDAGYYSNWHYSDSDIQQYCEIINDLKIDIIEIGYRNPPSEAFKGSLYYCPSVVLKKFDQILDKSVEKYLMIDFKCVTNHDENIKRIESVKNYIDGIRIAVDANQTKGLNNFIKSLTELDLKVSINLMYGHKYLSGDLSFDDIKNIIDMKNIEILSIVDSYGCVFLLLFLVPFCFLDVYFVVSYCVSSGCFFMLFLLVVDQCCSTHRCHSHCR